MDNLENENIQIDEQYAELLQNIGKLKDSCINNSLSAIRLKRINDYSKTTYPELQKDFETRFPKTYGINGFKNYIKLLDKIIIDTLNKNIDEEYYLSLNDENVRISTMFTNVLLKFLSNNLNLEETKKAIFLVAHDIDFTSFYKLNQNGIMSLCEMAENGIDINEFNSAGNLKLNFLNDLSKGAFKQKTNEALKKEQIIDCIERCLKDYSLEQIQYNDDFTLYFDGDVDEVTVYTSKDINKPIAIINENGEFIKGSLNIILITVYRNIDDQSMEQNKNLNTIDNIINRYNEMAEQQTSQQPDLASALRMALGLGSNNTNSSNGNSN